MGEIFKETLRQEEEKTKPDDDDDPKGRKRRGQKKEKREKDAWRPKGPTRREKAGNGGRGKATTIFPNGKS